MRTTPPLPLSLRPWPDLPKVELIDGAQIASWVHKIKETQPQALGLHLHESPHGEQPPPQLWVSLSRSEDARMIFEIRPTQWSELAPLSEYLSQASAPFVVVAKGQRLLHALAKAELSPHRLGCLKSAHSLVARAKAEPIREDLVQWVAQSFDRNLPASPEHEVDALIPLMRHWTAALRELGLMSAYQLECALLPAVVAMEQAGMPLDAAAYEGVAQSWVRERQDCQDPARARKLDKLISTYRYWGRDFLDGDGRIRCHLDPLATESGRFSCANPNLQQVPNAHTAPGLRACFRPERGHAFVVADYAQIELRVAAHIANCDAMRTLFVQGQDPHRNTAATLRGCRPDQVTPGDRKLAKAINFGFLFGMGAARFSSYAQQSYGLELSESQAKAAKSAFLSAYPGIAAWQQRTAALGQGPPSPVQVRTALGRIKHFPADAFRFNAALNIPVQGTAAEGFKKAMLRLHRELPLKGGLGVLCIHDEYIAQVPIQRAEELKALVVTVMEQEMQSVVPSVPIRAEATVCEAWT